MPVHVIALSGRRLTGKDTMASALTDVIWSTETVTPCVAVTDHLAFPLKKLMAARHGVDPALLNTQGTKEQYRMEMVNLGKAFRRIDPDILPMLLWDRNEGSLQEAVCWPKDDGLPHKIVLVPDVRFVSELDYFRRKSNVMLHIHMHISDRRIWESRGWTAGSADKTSTETEMEQYVSNLSEDKNGFVRIIDNSGSMADLNKYAQSLAEEFLERIVDLRK